MSDVGCYFEIKNNYMGFGARLKGWGDEVRIGFMGIEFEKSRPKSVCLVVTGLLLLISGIQH